MTFYLLLDILLVLLVSLLIPIGWWRGPVKELFVTLGLLFGILLADYWARPWGRDLSDVSSLTSGAGAFVVAWAFLVASTFILGYGIGSLLYPAWHLQPARALGAAIGAFNGILLLSFSLQYIRLFLLSDSNEESLEDSYVAQFLLDQVGWVVLLVAFIALPLMLYLLITGQRAYLPDDEYDEYSYQYAGQPVPTVQQAERPRVRTSGAGAQTLPPRVPATPDPATTAAAAAAYKSDPPQRRRKPTAETRPLIVTEPQATAEPTPTTAPDEPAAERMNDTDPHIIIPPQAAQAAQAAPSSAPPDASPTTDSAAAQPSDAQSVSETASASPGADGSDLAPGYTRCVNCHAVLAPDTTICPKCGTLR
jgi:uncharacterized membrane protein required for colicin V production